MTTTAPEHAPAVLPVNPLNQRCPHCRAAAVLLTGDPADTTAECGNCGRAWGSETWARWVQGRKQAAA